MTVDPGRVTVLRDGTPGDGPVMYWISRDQRADDNWALAYAREQAHSRNVPLVVVFCLVPAFSGAGFRQYEFMLRGLEETAGALGARGIPLVVLTGEPVDTLPVFAARHRCGLMVTDFDPLPVKRAWKQTVVARIDIPLIEVDAHNIVPCRIASNKQEYGAYTIRKKITSRLDTYLKAFPDPAPQPVPWQDTLDAPDWGGIRETITADRTVVPVTAPEPGSQAAETRLFEFIGDGLARYADQSNDPNADAVSHLSPYLHFGQIAAQRVALEVLHAAGPHDHNAEAFLEQLIVRRELADNFCHHCGTFDRLDCLPDWARKSLEEHRDDPREYRYRRDQFEQADTHDPFWNAAQRRLTVNGYLHGYLRMYWAKKILEWSVAPQDALETAIFLNDRYLLDGRDPNGYVGILWSIGGLHDRAWGERPVFGKIRYMSLAGARRKFDVDAFIAASPPPDA